MYVYVFCDWFNLTRMFQVLEVTRTQILDHALHGVSYKKIYFLNVSLSDCCSKVVGYCISCLVPKGTWVTRCFSELMHVFQKSFQKALQGYDVGKSDLHHSRILFIKAHGVICWCLVV